MNEWKTLDEILPEMGRAVESDPENWREQFEFKCDSDDVAITVGSLFSSYIYRRKPHTMKYSVERPKPMLERPNVGDEYFIPAFLGKDWSCSYLWLDEEFHFDLFNRGLCYATREEAVAAAKAMVGDE